jgi:hypothetical protein
MSAHDVWMRAPPSRQRRCSSHCLTTRSKSVMRSSKRGTRLPYDKVRQHHPDTRNLLLLKDRCMDSESFPLLQFNCGGAKRWCNVWKTKVVRSEQVISEYALTLTKLTKPAAPWRATAGILPTSWKSRTIGGRDRSCHHWCYMACWGSSRGCPAAFSVLVNRHCNCLKAPLQALRRQTRSWNFEPNQLPCRHLYRSPSNRFAKQRAVNLGIILRWVRNELVSLLEAGDEILQLRAPATKW